MSIKHYKYINEIDLGTVYSYSSQLASLPAINVQNSILSKVWRTDSNFVITGNNDNLPFLDTSTGTVVNYGIPSGTYTAAALAIKMASGLNSVGESNHAVTYNTSTHTFNIARASGTFSLMFGDTDYKNTTVAVITGFGQGASLTGAANYTSTSSTLGNEHEIIISLTATNAVSCLIIDEHEFSSTVLIRLRGTDSTATDFEGGWNITSTITLISTVAYTEDRISIEFTEANYKALQLYFYDRDKSYSDIGRLWAGTYFSPTYQATNVISFRNKKLDHRSTVFISQAGASFFDKKDRLLEYTIPTPVLDQYYDNATKIGFENMLDEVGNDKPFYVSLDNNVSTSTVYVYLLGDPVFKRLKNTTMFNLGDLKFRQQK